MYMDEDSHAKIGKLEKKVNTSKRVRQHGSQYVLILIAYNGRYSSSCRRSLKLLNITFLYSRYFSGAPGSKQEFGKFINSRRKDKLKSCGFTSSMKISYLKIEQTLIKKALRLPEVLHYLSGTHSLVLIQCLLHGSLFFDNIYYMYWR